MTPRGRRFARLMAIACITMAPAVVGACSSDDQPGGNGPMTTSNATSGTSDGDTATLETPDTLPDGNFPSVENPDRDGWLTDIHLELTTVAEADQPMALVARPGHTGQLFLAERDGYVRLLTKEGGSRLRVHDPPLVDMSDAISTEGEMGLLSIAFDTAGDTLYLSYNIKTGDSRIDAVTVTGDSRATKLGEPTNLLGVDQMGTTFHKGGNLIVDEDDLLYAGFGDGGPQNDADQHAQDPNLLLGKILRIDPQNPSDGKPYGIPHGNPHADGGGAPEIWLTGLRNPWRFSIDPATGDTWIADVGQDAIEEVSRLPGGPVADGRNMGWSGYEGTFVFEQGRVKGPSVPPIFEISHDDGVCSITGGVVYRGTKLDGLNGVYLYSDLCRAGIYGIRADTPTDGIGQVTDERLLAGAGDIDQVIAFATDADGEVYVLSMDDTIRRLDPAD